METFQEEKLRDTAFRKRFYEKLEQIRTVRKTNKFLTYRCNKGLTEDLKDIYRDNLKEYNISFELANSNLIELKEFLMSSEALMHKGHFCQFDLSEIENLISQEDYNKNRAALPLIKEQEQKVIEYCRQFHNWKISLANLTQKIYSSSVDRNTRKWIVWKESIDLWNEYLLRCEKELFGNTLVLNDFKLKQEWVVLAKTNYRITRFGLRRLLKNKKTKAEYNHFFRVNSELQSKYSFDDFAICLLAKDLSRTKIFWNIVAGLMCCIIVCVLLYLYPNAKLLEFVCALIVIIGLFNLIIIYEHKRGPMQEWQRIQNTYVSEFQKEILLVRYGSIKTKSYPKIESGIKQVFTLLIESVKTILTSSPGASMKKAKSVSIMAEREANSDQLYK